MSSTLASTTRTVRIPIKRIVRAGVIAMITALVANAIVYFIASAVGWMPSTYINPQLGRPIGVGEVISSTIAGAVGATVVFALLARFTRRPVPLFRIVALMVLVLSFGMPSLALPGAPLSLVLTLNVLHVLAAALIVWVLTTRTFAT